VKGNIAEKDSFRQQLMVESLARQKQLAATALAILPDNAAMFPSHYVSIFPE